MGFNSMGFTLIQIYKPNISSQKSPNKHTIIDVKNRVKKECQKQK